MAEKPDIVALQEVDQKTRRASGVDQPAELARLTGMQVVFGRNIDFEGGGYGTAVLTEAARAVERKREAEVVLSAHRRRTPNSAACR